MKHFYLFFLVAVFFCKAQKNDSLPKRALIYSAGVEYGTILPTNIALQDYENRNYRGYSFQLMKQSTGKNDWEKDFRYPQYGIGFFAFDFMKNREMKSPFAIYGIYNAKIKQWGKLKWFHTVNFGISFNARPFDEDEKYYNISLGSRTNMFISMGTGIYYEMGKHFDIGLNFKFNHLSNGGLKIPNKGLNTVAPQLSLTYYPERMMPQKPDSAVVDDKRYTSLEVSVFGGRKNAFYRGEGHGELKNYYSGFNYSVYGTEVLYMRQYSRKSAYGIGVGITMDDHYNHEMYVSDSTLYQKKRFSADQPLLSIMPSYRLIMGRLYVNLGAGYYLAKKQRKYDNSIFFQRIALQYQITDRLFASFGINAYDMHVANYLEWKLGYTFIRKKIK